MLLLAAIASLISLTLDHREAVVRLTRDELAFCLALSAPLLAAFVSEASHGEIIWRTLDSPSRFLLGIPVFLAFRRNNLCVLRHLDWAIVSGALSCLLVLIPQFHEWGKMRMESYYMNAIHFGDVALLLAIMTLISLKRTDSAIALALRIAAVGSALVASFLTGSRGGWIAIPAFALTYIAVPHRNLSWRSKVSVVGGITATLILVFVASPYLRDRVDEIFSNLSDYTAGQRDTSVGIRLQLYEAAVRGIGQAPIFGLGADGFKRLMPVEIEKDSVTALAGAAGEGEVHNQLLAYGADYGLLGIAALLAVYIFPSLLFWRVARNLQDSVARREASLLGLALCACFIIFGLTVETFNLKATVSLYVALLVILAAASAPRHDASLHTPAALTSS